MKVLLTGGAGFIGSHTVERLLRRGDTVVVVDSVNDYYDVAIKREGLANLTAIGDERPGSLKVHEFDLTDRDRLRAVFEEEKPDAVCHLAAQAGVRHSIEHVDTSVTSNILATTNILECCRDFPPKNVVIASSSSVYGVSSTAPFSEDQICDKPISPYAASKRTCELFGHTFHHLYKLNITMLRFFTVYGPRGRPDMAAFKFIDCITKEKPIDKYGDGSMIREFTYIDDIVDGVVASIDTVSPWAVLNLGGGSTHTLNDLIATIEKYVGKAAVLNCLPVQPGDVHITSADQTNAKRVLNFAPKVSLDDGIRLTVEWYKAWQERKKADA